MKKLLTTLLLLLLTAAPGLLAQSVTLNEVMSSSRTAIFDEDGDSPDRIELFNPGASPVDLAGKWNRLEFHDFIRSSGPGGSARDKMNLTAVFEPYTPDSAVINEINYNSALDFNTEDWVEFYNPSGQPLNFAGWTFRDEEDIHGFEFPAGTIIPPQGYLVLCADTTAFLSLFPEVENYTGNFDFGLSGGGELLRLYDFSMLLIDTVHYDDVAPWPPDADGLGPTLELIDPALDNALPESWAAYLQHGTPGRENGIYTSVEAGSDDPPADCKIIPNPARGSFSFLLTSGTDREATIEIFDAFGQRVGYRTGIKLSEGERVIPWDGRNLAAGVYYCRISRASGNVTLKLIRTE